jgi:alpha-1,3-rhamnosyl/mannosyltransferase
VLAGAGLPPGFEAAAGEDLAEGRIELLGYQPREDLDRILGSALAVLYPSEDEGFGLPVIEAMAAGSPVITGACPATREVAGDAALPIDPGDPSGSIADGLRRLREDPAMGERLLAGGRRQAEGFGWDRTAEAYARLYDEAAG